jgi:hypothetical protein
VNSDSPFASVQRPLQIYTEVARLVKLSPDKSRIDDTPGLGWTGLAKAFEFLRSALGPMQYAQFCHDLEGKREISDEEKRMNKKENREGAAYDYYEIKVSPRSERPRLYWSRDDFFNALASVLGIGVRSQFEQQHTEGRNRHVAAMAG